MAGFNSIISEFMEAIGALASVWLNQEFPDEKMKEIGEAVIKPIADKGKRISDMSQEVNDMLSKLRSENLISGE